MDSPAKFQPTETRGDAAIVSTPGTCGGKPRVDGTRLTVQNIVLWHIQMKMPVDQILDIYPSLTPASIGAALDYYERNPAEILDSLKREEAFAEMIEEKQASSPLLARLRETADAHRDDSVPSG